MSSGEGEAQVQAGARGGLTGRIFFWAAVGFNLLMAAWLVSYLASAGKMKAAALAAARTAADRAAAGDSVAAGAGLLLGLWLFGAVMLGLLAALTRKPRA
jgi:hypothetical protein